MAKFVNGSKKSPTIVLNEPADLARWVESVLKTIAGPWEISVSEDTGVILRAGRLAKTHHFVLTARRADWSGFHGFWMGDKLVAVAKRFQEKGWPEILQELEKRARGEPIRAEQISPERSIESRQPAIEHVTRALPAPKRLALTDKSKRPSQQLLLLGAEPCCNWPGCSERVKSQAWACGHHWKQLPSKLQELISVSFRPDADRVTQQWLDAEAAVHLWIQSQTNH